MDILKQNNTKVFEFAEQLAEQVNQLSTPKDKKQKGQYFTSPSIAQYMASLVKLDEKTEVTLLDPGGGTGVLTAALIERIISEKRHLSLQVDIVENDEKIIPFLQQMMELCSKKMSEEGNTFEYRIIREDFIIKHAHLFEHDLLSVSTEIQLYNVILSNPPYFKVSKSHEYSRILKDYVYGQPNVYFMFMIVAQKLLNTKGQLVFITPRSYSSGAYFERFREHFFAEIDADHIHVFNSRKGNFKGESVLQENIILSGFKRTKKHPYIAISSSSTGFLEGDYQQEVFPKSLIFDSSDQVNMIRIPLNQKQANILEIFDQWSNNLTIMNMNISTGPVVTFRNKDFLSSYSKHTTYPLLRMKHLKELKIKFPVSDHDEGIIEEGKTKKLLLPSRNYILLKRFTSKEQKKRVDCAAYNKDFHSFTWIGLENHMNYIYKLNGELSERELYGILAFLNSDIVDQYFRIINGNTQVNASDIRPLPFPQYGELIKLGEGILNQNIAYDEVDSHVTSRANEEKMAEGGKLVTKEDQALDILAQLELPKKQQNKRSALTLLALTDIKKNSDWNEAQKRLLRIVDIMEFMREHYGQDYAPNSRETIRRQTIHQFEQAQLIIRNPDDPSRPTNSGNTVYAVSDEFLKLMLSYGTSEWGENLSVFKNEFETLSSRYESKRELTRVPVKVNSDFELKLSPGEHNVLQKAIVEEFAEFFAQGSELLYLGDTEDKFLYIDKEKLNALNFPPMSHEKLPDVVLYDPKKNWVYLIEAVTSHGPISPKRKFELEKMLERSTAGIIFITAFPNISIFKQYADDIAWDTEIWFSDNPQHMMHLNGDRFVGPRN